MGNCFSLEANPRCLNAKGFVTVLPRSYRIASKARGSYDRRPRRVGDGVLDVGRGDPRDERRRALQPNVWRMIGSSRWQRGHGGKNVSESELLAYGAAGVASSDVRAANEGLARCFCSPITSGRSRRGVARFGHANEAENHPFRWLWATTLCSAPTHSGVYNTERHLFYVACTRERATISWSLLRIPAPSLWMIYRVEGTARRVRSPMPKTFRVEREQFLNCEGLAQAPLRVRGAPD